MTSRGYIKRDDQLERMAIDREKVRERQKDKLRQRRIERERERERDRQGNHVVSKF